jgi:hypothetical protein
MVGQDLMKMLLADQSLARTDAERESFAYGKTTRLTDLLSDHLPALPWFLRELRCALEDGSTHLDRVVSMLRVHPAVCENFVRIGSLAEPAQPIRLPLDHLVILLGKRRTWAVAVTSFVLSEIGSPWSTLTQKEVSDLSLKTAGNLLDRANQAEDEEPEQAFVRGALSIAGLLPMIDSCGLTDRVPDWVGTSPEAAQLQRELFGTDFVELNCWIRLLWGVEVDFSFASPTAADEPETKDRSIAVTAPVSDPVSRNLVIVPRGN